jgi:hypothetical protein
VHELDLKLGLALSLSNRSPSLLLISSFIASEEEAAEHETFPIEQLPVRFGSVRFGSALFPCSSRAAPHPCRTAPDRSSVSSMILPFLRFLMLVCPLATNLENDFALILTALR